MGVIQEQPFRTSFTYLSFLWDIDNKLVMLTDCKREKYKAIRDWNSSPRHNLQETEKLHSKLLYATHIIPKGCIYLSGLEHLMATQCDKPHVSLMPSKGTEFELEW
jgi:hypothetical protein